MNGYDELAALAEAGKLVPIPGTIRRGEEARNETRRLLMEATGASTLDEAVRTALSSDDEMP